MKTPLLLEMPTAPEPRRQFLEGQLAGLTLGQFVDELIAARQAAEIPLSSRAPTLDEWLGDHKDSVMQSGLSTLSEERIQAILQHPQLLSELQDRILDEGGDYWLDLMNRQVSVLSNQQKTGENPKVNIAAARQPTVANPGETNQRRSWSLGLAVLAALFMAWVVTRDWGNPPQPTWGFAKPGVFETEQDAPTYLNHLAETAGTWFNKRPDSKVGLTKRLSEFRIGCSQLLVAEHRQLNTENQEWLRDRCRKWIDKIDGHLADLQGDEKTLSTVLEESDSTIVSLQTALRDQAKKLS